MIRGMNLCSIAGCTHEAEEAGMCNMHFTSALVHGALDNARDFAQIG